MQPFSVEGAFGHPLAAKTCTLNFCKFSFKFLFSCLVMLPLWRAIVEGKCMNVKFLLNFIKSIAEKLTLIRKSYNCTKFSCLMLHTKWPYFCFFDFFAFFWTLLCFLSYPSFLEEISHLSATMEFHRFGGFVYFCFVHCHVYQAFFWTLVVSFGLANPKLVGLKVSVIEHLLDLLTQAQNALEGLT